MTKLTKKYSKDLTMYLLQTYSKSKRLYSDGYFEQEQTYILYLNRRTKRVLEEHGMTIKDQTYTWVSKTKHRSIKAMIAKLNLEYERFSNIIGEYEIEITKIGDVG